jgi:predicted HTH transcriptional regulator
VLCERCKDTIASGEEFNFRGQTLCEDCYIGAIQPPKTCDVAAVHAAKKHREATGQTGVEGLSELQKKIYHYIENNDKVTKEQLATAMKIPPWELEKQFAVLRHCELVKGKKDGNNVYLVLFND